MLNPLAALFLAVTFQLIRAYVPAQATNDTTSPGIRGILSSQNSSVNLEWYNSGATEGSVLEPVSYQLAANGTNGLTQGALVHFSEFGNLTNQSASDFSMTPWIAFVSCDSNSTTSSNDTDIFTFAQNRGAIAALLYSERSNSCVINTGYKDPDAFSPIMDIYSLESISLSQLIQSRFSSLLPQYRGFNASLLNTSLSSISQAIAGNQVGPGYIFATLQAGNATAVPATGENNTSNTGGGGGGHHKSNLAMIILYTITGCVSALFCIVILSGAIRAFRHPERYGRRANTHDPTHGLSNTRTAVGLTRAILDTFPIIKFGGAEANANASSNASGRTTEQKGKDLEAGELVELKEGNGKGMHINSDGKGKGVDEADLGELGIAILSAYDRLNGHPEMDKDHSKESREPKTTATRQSTLALTSPGPGSSNTKEIVSESLPLSPTSPLDPTSIGRETCPICILDFELGDDIRVLLCEGKHRFHQRCVDQWLLEVSSSCPICREDLQTLEAMVQNEGPSDRDSRRASPSYEDESGNEMPQPIRSIRERSASAATSSSGRRMRQPRLSLKYLRFAQRRRDRAVNGNTNDDNTGAETTSPSGTGATFVSLNQIRNGSSRTE